jgi:co-chaperonin GroES (HSP10)
MRSSSNKREVGSLGKIGDARLDLVPLLADCHPGIRPIEYNVIIATVPSTDSDKIGSVFIPDEAKETLDLAMQVGRIVAQSPLAYSYEKWPDPSQKPQVGQVVWFARYAGKEFEGADGKMYRILKDKDIGAVIEEAATSAVTLSSPERPAAVRHAAMCATQITPEARCTCGADNWLSNPSNLESA